MSGKSRQGYYQREEYLLKKGVEEELILHHIREIRMTQPRLGGRKMYRLLKPTLVSENIDLGRDKFFDLLRRNNLLVPHKRSCKVTTNSNHPYYKYSNKIQDITPERKNQVWVSDITYISLKEGHGYLSLITDLYSRKIVGFHIHENLETEGPLKALNQALRQRKRTEELIHHSDRGGQYCSYAYTELLQGQGITISMGEAGNPYENAVAERINGILKHEFYLDDTFDTLRQARSCIRKVVHIYNTKRPHLSCNFLTPEEAHKQTGPLQKQWKKYERKKTENSEKVKENV